MRLLNKRSIWIYHIKCATCNGCDISLQNIFNMKFDAEKYGISIVNSIKHADCIVITGTINNEYQNKIREYYSCAPKPVTVIALGTCPSGKGLFSGSYNVNSTISETIPVDIHITGCPPRPNQILKTLTEFQDMHDEKQKDKKKKKKKGIIKL